MKSEAVQLSLGLLRVFIPVTRLRLSQSHPTAEHYARQTGRESWQRLTESSIVLPCPGRGMNGAARIALSLNK